VHEAASVPTDTALAAERVRAALYREMPPWRKAALIDDAIRTTRWLAFAGIQSRHAHEPLAAQRRRLVEMLLGPDLAEKVTRR
jgi:hypothetical protein